MKSIAVFLTLCILFLSSVSGMTNTLHRKVSESCCKESAHKDCCKQQKHNADNDCAKGNCNAMLSCGTCGFVITAPLSISPIISILSSQSVRLFVIGELSDYHGDGWNPPKA